VEVVISGYYFLHVSFLQRGGEEEKRRKEKCSKLEQLA